jgi:hypothetical protein
MNANEPTRPTRTKNSHCLSWATSWSFQKSERIVASASVVSVRAVGTSDETIAAGPRRTPRAERWLRAAAPRSASFSEGLEPVAPAADRVETVGAERAPQLGEVDVDDVRLAVAVVAPDL